MKKIVKRYGGVYLLNRNFYSLSYEKFPLFVFYRINKIIMSTFPGISLLLISPLLIKPFILLHSQFFFTSFAQASFNVTVRLNTIPLVLLSLSKTKYPLRKNW